MSTQGPNPVAQLDAIVDAVSQGRLTPADVAGLSSDELDAIYAMGQMRFESGQLEQAIVMWAACVALDPYQARAWRALGIAHHHRGALHQASAAYAAALYLEPGHGLTAAYAAEVHLLLGEHSAAQYYARLVHRSQDGDATGRLSKLWQNPTPAPVPAKAPAPAPAPLDTSEFTLPDGRRLPLIDSTYAPAGETDETTLVYDLAHAVMGGLREHPTSLAPPTEVAEALPPATSLPLPMLAVSMPSFVPPKERTVTGLSQTPVRVLPEATAARRMGRMLTEEITIGPNATRDEEVTQAHPTRAKKDS